MLDRLHAAKYRYVEKQGDEHGCRAQQNQYIDRDKGHVGEEQQEEKHHEQKRGTAFAEPLGAV